MVYLQTFHLAHLPPSFALHLALYEDVKNAAFLHQQLLLANTEFEYAFIDASTIISPNHVLAAVFRAVNDFLNSRLKSRNVHSEIVFALSPNNSIAASFRSFGITPSTSSLLVVKLSTAPSTTASAVSHHLSAVIDGTSVEFNGDNLAKLSDIRKIRKIYKLGDARLRKESSTSGATNGVTEDSERRELEVLATGIMALRGQT